MNPKIRTAVYSILAAATALIVAYGVISEDEATLWLALAVAILDALALIMATRYVPAANKQARRADHG